MHGTTSGAMKPHDFTLRPSTNGFRAIGRTRPALLEASGRPLREVFRCAFPLPCTTRQLSGGKREHLLHPIHVFLYWRYPNKSNPICQALFIL